jgi:hypothetical protein
MPACHLDRILRLCNLLGLSRAKHVGIFVTFCNRAAQKKTARHWLAPVIVAPSDVEMIAAFNSIE